MPTPIRPILALDSAGLYYRAFHSLPESLTAPDGRPHNAVRGFLSTVTRLVDAHSPSGLVACWDNDWRPQWRVDLLPGYKAHRVAVDTPGQEGVGELEPESLTPQVVAIAELLDAAGIARFGVDGFEADDALGSIAAQSRGPVIVVSGDRDLVQVVDASTTLLLTVNGGMDAWPLLDRDGVIERFHVPAGRYVDFAVLRGDPSDGLPGVPGIGAKTAAALVNAFDGIDGILRAAEAGPDVRPMTPRLATALVANRDVLHRARQVATIVRDLPIPEIRLALPSGAAEVDRLAELAGQWGVSRQIEALMASLRSVRERQTADE